MQSPMLNVIAQIETAGANVLTLTEGLEADEFQRSRLTRQETRRQLLLLASAMTQLPLLKRQQMSELDWDGWATLMQQLANGHTHEADALWFAIRSLTPATLMWLRFYRERQPELFASE